MDAQAIKNMDFNTRYDSLEKLEESRDYYAEQARNKQDGNPRSVKKYFEERIAKMKAAIASAIELKHNQQIRTSMDKYEPEIIVCTVRGCVEDHNNRYGSTYKQDVEEELKRALENGHDIVWTNLSPSVLEADYPGKAEAHARKRERYANATLIENKSVVKIEDHFYLVVYTGPNYSDPVHFKQIA